MHDFHALEFREGKDFIAFVVLGHVLELKLNIPEALNRLINDLCFEKLELDHLVNMVKHPLRMLILMIILVNLTRLHIEQSNAFVVVWANVLFKNVMLLLSLSLLPSFNLLNL